MDVQMPGMDGLEATRRITKDATSAAAVLVLTTFNREDYLFAALDAGASGFLLKNSSPEQLIEAVQVVARGDALLSPDVTRRVIEAVAGRTASMEALRVAAPGSSNPALESITDREREALELLAEGLSNAEIAERMWVGDLCVREPLGEPLEYLALAVGE